MTNIEGPLLYEQYRANLFFLNYEYVGDTVLAKTDKIIT